MAASLEPQCRIVILITFLRIARPRPRQCGPQNVQYLEFDHSVFGMLCSVYVLNVLHDWGKIRVFLPYFITCTDFIRFFQQELLHSSNELQAENCRYINPFNARCSKLLLFEGLSAILV